MKMENIFPHKRNTNVTVLDQIFRIGDGGFIEDQNGKPLDVPHEYALRLVQGRAWRELGWDPEDPANASRFASHNAPLSQGRGRPPRSRQQIETDYGVEMGPEGNAKVALLKGKVVPTAAAVDSEGLDALGIIEDRGAPPSGERLERMAKADVDQVAQSLKAAGGGEEADTLAVASIASVPTGGAEIGDGRKPAASVPEPPEPTSTGPDLAPPAPPPPPSAPVATTPPAPPPPPGAAQATFPTPLAAPPAPPAATETMIGWRDFQEPQKAQTIPPPGPVPTPLELEAVPTPPELEAVPPPHATDPTVPLEATPTPALLEAVPPAPATAPVFQGESGATYTVPADGDWPDPTDDMPLEYVQEMAKAYDVTHNARTSRKVLVKRINGAMYE